MVAWTLVERRTASPLEDVSELDPVVLRANLAMFVGGVGMYLLLTLVTRYVQTPEAAGTGSASAGALFLVLLSGLARFGGTELDADDEEQVAATAAVEPEASRRDPYRRLSRVFHLVGRKGPARQTA